MPLSICWQSIIVWLGMICTTGWGQVSGINFVTRADRSRGSLRVDVTDMGAGGNGAFSKVVVTISSNPATTADRNLTVIFYKKAWGEAGEHVAYQYPVTLAEGMSQTVVEIPYVATAGQFAWDVELWEGGRNIEDRRGNRGSEYQWSYRDNNLIQAVNFIYDPATESSDQFLTTAAQQTNKVAIPDQTVSIAATPSDWRMYLPYSRWLISAQTFLKLHEQNPKGAEALHQYVAAGGSLLIYSAGSKQGIHEIKKVLPSTQLLNVEDETETLRYMFGTFIATRTDLHDLPSPEHQFVVLTMQTWKSLMVTPSNDGDWFWRNMILAVGKPPVWAFCVMVTLFGGLLGPGLLFYTGRMKRRSLMIFLVPSLSLLATLSIIAYGILYEGFDTHTRTSSVQFIDRNGEGFAWARQNYFSGLPPREGLTFPGSAYVRTVSEPSDNNYYGNPDPRRASQTIRLEDDQQQWLRWLQARQQQQLLVGQPVEGVKLPVRLEQVEPGRLRVINLTDGFLPVVVARGAKEDYYTTSVDPGASVVVEAVDRVEAGASAARMFADYRPEVPAELLGSNNQLQLGWRTNSGIVGNRPTDVIIQTFNAYLTDQLVLPSGGVAVVSLSPTEGVRPPIDGLANNDVHLIVGTEAW